ncbi:hypothetical protein BJ322DRAFT_1018047 [Thelephora terrestris]|uniref:Uncharacterized protein n=1 Tax=Thelephora terrestris TaxID=56493 RepID=A0A9P6LAI8_9AGAM|nr:hypothetical protein BJ322DRAFT_1018047 [Thelephora terrestris]
MPRAQTRIPTCRSTSYSPVQESNYNIDRFSHARRDPSRPYPTLGSIMDRTATADPNEGFSDLGGGSACFRDFLQAARRVSRRKLARIETNPYANELLNRGVEFMTESNETFNSVLEASVLHTGNVGSMLMDEVAHVNERVDVRREEIEALESWKEDMQGVIHGQEDSVVRQGADIDSLKGEVTTLKDLVRVLVTKTGELEDDKVRLYRRISELTGEVQDLQRRCNEPGVRVEEEELEVPERAESPPARLMVQYENRNRWPALEFDPYAEFVPDSEPNSDTELPDYEDLSDVDPNEIREQNWANEELSSRGNGGPGRGNLRMKGVNGEIITVIHPTAASQPHKNCRGAPPYLFLVTDIPALLRELLIKNAVFNVNSTLKTLFFKVSDPVPHDYVMTLKNYNLPVDTEDEQAKAVKAVRQSAAVVVTLLSKV